MIVEDEVLQEIREYREALAARFSYDIRRMFAYFQEQEPKNPAPNSDVPPALPPTTEQGN